MKFSYIVHSILAAAALTLPGIAADAESVEQLVAQGDQYDQKFQAGEALKFYLPAEKLEPNNTTVLLRIARQYRHLMTDAGPTAEKLRLGGIALGYAKRAAAVAPNDAETHASVAISYGKMLTFQGKKEQVEATPLIRAACERALALDPKNDNAWHVLGKWHRVLADVGGAKRALGSLIYGNLPKGTNEDAVHCLQKAIASNPKRPMHYIELGRTYAQMNNRAEARRFLEKGLAMPNTDKDDAEVKARGRETLSKLSGGRRAAVSIPR
jgi:cytochrome c-type biogenesis protein CcmH/NrfG